MPFLIIGVLIGMPLGVVVYFKLLAEMNEAGRKEATRVNTARHNEPYPVNPKDLQDA